MVRGLDRIKDSGPIKDLVGDRDLVCEKAARSKAARVGVRSALARTVRKGLGRSDADRASVRWDEEMDGKVSARKGREVAVADLALRGEASVNAEPVSARWDDAARLVRRLAEEHGRV